MRQRVVTRTQAAHSLGSADGARRPASVAVLSSRAADWEPVELVLLLLVLAVGSDRSRWTSADLRISGSFLALVLAMALLGPAPAAAIGVATAIVDMVVVAAGPGTSR